MITPDPKQILVVDDEPNLRRVLGAQLMRDGYEVHSVGDGEEALKILREQYIDVVITDLRMPKLDGMQLLRQALALEPELPIVIITAHGSVDNAVEALKTGAFDYITKPFDQNEVRNVIQKALKTRALSAADASKNQSVEAEARHGIIGSSAPIRELFATIDRVSDTPSFVLLTGETGTGKELVARALHDNSERRNGPFIKLNCAAVPPELLESELLGYEPGAFAGAVSAKPGRFELASAGTLFLDEVGSIPLSAQVVLLRVLTEGRCERLGGSARNLDVRLITAARSDLRVLVREGRFREDLYYRLSVVPITLPPLRERTSDILILASHFIKRFGERLNHAVRGLEPETQKLLLQYRWPGNVRELENVIERAVLFCDGELVRPRDLPTEIRDSALGELPPLPVGREADGLKEQVKAATSRLERELIERALRQTNGNVTHAARLLKISRKGLQLKMKELGLRERDDRALI
jgi:two-component system, NtrC family, response regulator AtoC